MLTDNWIEFFQFQVFRLSTFVLRVQKTVTMMLEDKIARETEKRVQEEERNQLQAEISRLTDALEQEKKRGFWSRLFRSGSE